MKRENYENMHSVLTDLDDNAAELDDLQNLLTVFNDLFETETEALRTNPGHLSADVFAARLPLLISTLNVIRFRLTDILKDTNHCIRKGYSLIGIQTETDSESMTA